MSQNQRHGTGQQGAPGEVATITVDAEAAGLVEQLEGTIVHLQRMMDCRSRESLQQPGHDGHWGMVEILCYLRDWEVVIHDRVRRMLEEETPAFTALDTTMWPLEHDYGAQDSYEVFHELAALRGALAGTIREMTPEGWQRAGIFEGHGEMTLRDVMERVGAHDQRYLQEARDAAG